MSSTDVLGDLVRARVWDDYIGQTRLKTHLEVKIDAAVNDGRYFDHTLLVATPGAGKTTLARLIADRLNDSFLHLLMPMKLSDLISAVEDFEGGVIMLDELHAAPTAFQEALQPALEDGYLPGSYGEKVSCRHVTFIGATTTAMREKVLEPLVDRFKYHPVWEPYSDEEMGEIVAGMASRADVDVDVDLCRALGRATGGTPRVAGDLVAAARDLVAVGRTPSVEMVLDLAGYDLDGLTRPHLEYLTVLRDCGGRAGLSTLANLLRVSAAALQNVERLLVIRGYVRLEPNGRRITPEGKAKLGHEVTDPRQRRRHSSNGAT